ncbi:lysylphosphatidylglycerol synthase domain-containing protein [Consotaella aegiceratis]|uniref:lysylphosphatidylglycerol synthase domain-containing protein n=1 Tax=Consotaella aegiceratis TaxID=3097961 RepID=UPI003D8011E7
MGLVAGLAVAAFLLARTLGQYSLDELTQSVTSFPLSHLALAGLFALASYATLTGFDYLAIRYVGHKIPYPKIALASFVALSLGHSIGFAGVSSGAIRYRFYSRWGVSLGDAARIVLFSGMTVGLGLATLGGIAILLKPDLASKIMGLSQTLAIALGLACLGGSALFLLIAATVRRRLTLWRWSIEMPTFKLACGQIVVGTINFTFAASCLHQALLGVADVPYLSAITVYVLANTGVVIAHVPGGLGVIEAVVMFLLPQEKVIGALLVFRFVYFLVPLAIGAVLFAVTEAKWRLKGPRRAEARA